jgi:hypothetical protein
MPALTEPPAPAELIPRPECTTSGPIWLRRSYEAHVLRQVCAPWSASESKETDMSTGNTTPRWRILPLGDAYIEGGEHAAPMAIERASETGHGISISYLGVDGKWHATAHGQALSAVQVARLMEQFGSLAEAISGIMAEGDHHGLGLALFPDGVPAAVPLVADFYLSAR